MELHRSPGGVLILGPSAKSRATEGSILSGLIVMTVGWIWLGGAETPRITADAVVETVVSVVLSLLLAGGLHLLYRDQRAEFAFDARRREVRRNGRKLCGFGDIQELRIVALIQGRGEDRPGHRLQLCLLRPARLLWIGGGIHDEDDVNRIAHAVANEAGVSVRLMR